MYTCIFNHHLLKGPQGRSPTLNYQYESRVPDWRSQVSIFLYTSPAEVPRLNLRCGQRRAALIRVRTDGDLAVQPAVDKIWKVLWNIAIYLYFIYTYVNICMYIHVYVYIYIHML